jgi:hypothetical protein
VQRTIDGDHVALSQHFLQVLYPATANLFTVKRLQPSQNPLANSTDRHRSNNLVLKIVLILRNGCDIPFAIFDLLVRGYKVAN